MIYNYLRNFSILNFVVSENYQTVAAILTGDLIQYVGIIFITAQLAKNYKTAHNSLLLKLVNISKVFIYIALLTNTVLLFGGFAFFRCTIFNGLYCISTATQVFKILLCSFTIAMYSIFPDPRTTKNFRILELPLLMHIILALSVTMVSSNNFALTLLALEGVSLTLYIMTALSRTYGGITASVKYFAFGTLGSIFLFWGTVHIYAIAPTLELDLVSALFANSYFENCSMSDSINFASTAISFGFMLKLGAAPVHQWVADVYAGVHFYITAYFSIFVKLIIFVIFLKIGVVFNYDALLTQFAVLCIIIGCFMSINQTEIKRLLAYSSIVHVGFLLMGDVYSSLIYLFTYLISSLLLFSVFLENKIAGVELVYLNDVNFLRRNNKSAIALVVALSSSAGLPPFAGFYGKFFIWSNLLEDIYISNDFSSYLCLFFSILVTLLTIFYYMKVIAYMFICSDDRYSVDSLHTTTPDFYRTLFSLETALMIFIVFWSCIQSWAIKLVQIVVVLI